MNVHDLVDALPEPEKLFDCVEVLYEHAWHPVKNMRLSNGMDLDRKMLKPGLVRLADFSLGVDLDSDDEDVSDDIDSDEGALGLDSDDIDHEN